MARMTREERLAKSLADQFADRRINVHRLAAHLLQQDPDSLTELVRTVSAVGDLVEHGHLTKMSPAVLAAIFRMRL